MKFGMRKISKHSSREREFWGAEKMKKMNHLVEEQVREKVRAFEQVFILWKNKSK